jgi:hypothetical protein
MNKAPREPIAAFLTGLSHRGMETLRGRVSKIAADLGSSSQQDRFIRVVDEAIGEYRLWSAEAASEHKSAKLVRQIERSANSMSEALEGLDRGTASLLAQKIWLSTSVRGPIDVELEADIKRIRVISAAASALPRMRVKGDGRLKDDVLIGDIARAYADCFDVAPSYSRSGIFAKLIKEVFQSAKITPVPDESHLKTVLSGIKSWGVEPPRRGRRKSKANTT